MKTSSELAWTRKQRAALSGARAPHPLDPPREDRGRASWSRIATWVAEASALTDRSPDAGLRAEIAAVRVDEPPTEHQPRREAIRRVLALAGIATRNAVPSSEPLLAASFACAWASQSLVAALTHPSEAPTFVGNAAELRLDRVVPAGPLWINDPWRPGGHPMNLGYAYFSALRRHVFELDEPAYASALRVATELRARVDDSDRDDRMTMLYVLAFVFSRDGSWAREHAEDCLDTPKFASFRGADLLAVSVTDPSQALALTRQSPSWLDPYGLNEPLLFDIVESLGGGAADVLRAIATDASKDRVRARVAEAITLSES